jgi:hypothetical protein
MVRARHVIVAGMVLILAIGIGAISAYKTTPPPATRQLIQSWPAASSLVRDPVSPTLILFAHPRCECTKASLVQLRDLMPRLEGRVRPYILFAKSEQGSESSPTENQTVAASIPGVTILPDEGAREADRFGAAASGQLMLFDTGGRLLFSGGIAPLHEYEGEAPMVRGLLAAVGSASGKGPPVAQVQMPNAVFGCALHGKGNAPDSPAD